MSSIDGKAMYEAVSGICASLKTALSTENGDQFVTGLYDDPKLPAKIETALFFEELILSELEDNVILVGLFRELRSSYISLLFLLQADAGPSLVSKGEPFSKLFLRSEHAINVRPLLLARFRERVDYMHLMMVFKDYIASVRRVDDLEAIAADQERLGRVLRFFCPDDDAQLGRLLRQVRKSLTELEGAGLVNDTVVFYHNSLGRYLGGVRSVVQMLELLNFLALFQPEFARSAVFEYDSGRSLTVQHDVLRSFIGQAFFFGAETEARLAELAESLRQLDAANGPRLDELGKALTQLRATACLLLDNTCIIINKALGSDSGGPKNEKLAKRFFADCFKDFLETLFKRLNDGSTSRLLVVRGIKYLVRNCPGLRALLETLRTVAFKGIATDPLLLRLKEMQKVKAPGPGARAELARRISAPPQEEAFAARIEKELLPEDVEDLKAVMHINSLVEKIHNDKEFQNEERAFKLMDKFSDAMYDDEFDDTFEGGLFSLGNARDAELNKADDDDDEEGGPSEPARRGGRGGFGGPPRHRGSARGPEPRQQPYSDRGSGRGPEPRQQPYPDRGQPRGRGRGLDRNSNQWQPRGRPQNEQPEPVEGGPGKHYYQKSDMNDLYVTRPPEENRFKKKEMADRPSEDGERGGRPQKWDY